MRKLLGVASSLAMLLLASGCQSDRPLYENKPTPNCAVLHGKKANIVKFFTDGDSHVYFVEVDGRYIQPSFFSGEATQVFVAPGTRRVTVHLYGSDYAQGQGEVQPGRGSVRRTG